MTLWDPIRALIGSGRGSAAGVSKRSIATLIDDYLRSGGEVTSEEHALALGLVYACVALIADNIATLPLHFYRRNPDGSRSRLPPVANLEEKLVSPNGYQDGVTLRGQLTAHALLRGNAYAWIEWRDGIGGGQATERIERLVPFAPGRVRPILSPDAASLVYEYTRPTGEKVRYPAEEMFHLRGLSWDGLSGLSVLELARQSFRVARETERYAGSFWEHDATPGIVITHPSTLNEETSRRLIDQWEALTLKRARATAVLEDGMKIERLTVTPEDSQFLETRKFQQTEICAWFRVPPHLIGLTDKSTSWGTGIESQNIGFLTHTLRTWLVRWESALRRSLIVQDRAVYAEHLVEGLLRADSKTRTDVYAAGRQWGWWSVNDIRRKENEDPIGPAGDVYLEPQNMRPAADPAATTGSAGG